jgi:hypothetical protein
MAKSGKPSTDDIELFRRSVGPVRKIHHDKTAPARKPPPSRPRRQAPVYEALLTDSFSDGFDSGEVTSDETLFFARPGLQQRQLQRLKRGQLAIGAELDMRRGTHCSGQLHSPVPRTAYSLRAYYSWQGIQLGRQRTGTEKPYQLLAKATPRCAGLQYGSSP